MISETGYDGLGESGDDDLGEFGDDDFGEFVDDDLGEFGDHGEGNVPPDLRSRDLPSKRLLGKGLASIGYETEWKGVRYARKDFVAVPSDIFRQEAVVLLNLRDHENVVKTHGLTVDKQSCSLLLDYMDDKLTNLLQKRKDLHEWSPAGEHDQATLQESLGLILQIARAMEHLHEHGIFHGDLKSRNILVTYVNDGDKSLSVKSVKVADFGLVETKRNSIPYVSHQARKLDMVRWRAPENLMELFREATSPDPDADSDEDFLGSACATCSEDAYCFGLTCFQILTGEEPYPKRNWKELVKAIVSNKRGIKLPRNLLCPQDLRELLDICCDADPEKRPTFFYIRKKLEHMHSLQPWVRTRSPGDPFTAESEPMEPISEALRIIEDATKSSNSLVNKHQCKRLELRLASVIGEELKELSKEFVWNQMDYPAFDMLLTVLRKATALLSKYTETNESIPSVLIRTEDREAFREIHAELDMLNSQFPFDDFQYASESMLTGDADKDKQELPGNLGQTATVAPANMEKMKVVVSEKIEGRATDDDLPSYLNIDPDSVEIKEPVRIPERLSSHDDETTDGWALVRFGTYLGCNFAIKVFKSGDKTWNRRELLKEVQSLMQLNHPHVVQLVGFAQDEEKCIILMELMDTDLRHFMKQRSHDGKRPFARSEELDIISQIARGMYYVHEQQHVHGELKCSNILVKQNGGYIDVKIADFRSSQKLGVWDPVEFKKRGSRRRPRWTAPEVTRYEESVKPTHELLKKMDVYSFGMVCFEVVTGKLPFQDLRGEALHMRIATGELKQELPGELDPKLRGLIKACWERDPSKRPSFEAICHVLNDIRTSQIAIATKSSGKEYTVQRLFRFIPFLRTDPSNLKNVSSRWYTDMEYTEGEGEDDADEEREGELGSAELSASLTTTPPGFVRINPTDLKLEGVIGKGSFADVYAGTWLGSKVAVKRLNEIQPMKVEKELKFLCEVRHPCIVQLIGASVRSDGGCSIVMELMGDDLRKVIDSRMQRRPLTEPVFSRQIAERAVFLDKLQIQATAYQPHMENWSHKQTKAFMLRKPCRTSKRASKASLSRKPSRTSKRASKASLSRKPCRTSKLASKALRPDLQLHSGSRKQNRVLGQVLEGAKKLQQHIDSRKPKETKRPAVLHTDVVPFDLHEAVYIITRIALGVAFLHSRAVAHRDLKAANVLVPEHPGSIDVKITDFGVANFFTSGEKLSLGVGTGFWVAPEMFRHRLSGEDQGMCRFDLKAADVYSFAMTCYEVLTGKFPMEDEIELFSHRQELKLAVVGGLRPRLPPDLNPDLNQLIRECWDENPEKRPTFSTICTKLQKIQQRLQRSTEVDTVGDVALPEFLRIDPRSLKKVRLIGEGAFAKVYEATWLGCRYAVKTFMSKSPEIVQQEVKVLVELLHPSIVRLMGLAVHPNRQCSIVMEYMGCSLRELIESRKRKRKLGSQSVPFEFHEAVLIITRIALGMAFLHSRGVIHRDLKAENVLVPEHSGSIDVKITGFAVSQLIDSAQKPSLGVGTTFWRAPEVFPRPPDVGDHHPAMISWDLKAADVYSFAMTCYEVVTGAVPLEHEFKKLKVSELRLKVIAGLRPTLPSDLNSDLKLLIEECWDGKPEKRPTFSSICQNLQMIQHGLQNSAGNLMYKRIPRDFVM